MNKWKSRVVGDVVGTAGSVVLDDEDTARVVLEDWLHDYYEIDGDEAEYLSENLCASVLTEEARQYARGLFGLEVEFDSEWSAERSAREVFEYMQGQGEPVTMGPTSLALGDDRDEALAGAWWKCGDEGEGWITDEADVEIAAEYLYAAAHKEN